MSTKHLVDIHVDPADERRRHRHALIRVGLPVGGVALIIVVILAITLYAQQANRHGVRRLSDGVLEELQARISLQVSTYLEPAARVSQLVGALASGSALGDRQDVAERFAVSALAQLPQIDAFEVADADGNFMMVRQGAAGGIDTKLIRNAPGARQVVWIRRNAAGQEIAREADPADTYDPRTRSWYTGAANSTGVFWTDVYIFFTGHEPGITASVKYHDRQGKSLVFGVDIALKALSEFLGTLRIGRTGRAVIVSGDGTLVALPDAQRMLREENGQLRPARVDQIGDPELTAAYDHYRVAGYGRRVITVGDRQIVSIVAPLPSAEQGWMTVIVVPESDFIGFVDSNSRTTLVMSLAVIAVATVLAAFLVRQGLRGDRMLRLLLRRDDAVRRQTAALTALAANAELFDPASERPPHALTEALAEFAAARRASVWRLAGDATILRCEDSYDRDSDGHVEGLELSRTEAPRFFASLATGEELDVADAARDPRTAEMARIIMQPLGSHALLVSPVRRGTQVIGAVCIEDPQSGDVAHDFVRAVANMAAVRMRNSPADTPPRSAPVTATAGAATEERSWSAELTPDRGDGPGGDGDPPVAVMVLHFTDPTALAFRPNAETAMLADIIACELQQLAGEHGIFYLKVLGQDIVAAATCPTADATVMHKIADTALAARDICARLFEDAGLPPSFRIGIECGTAVGSRVGHEPRQFNLWGEAMRTASAMAASVMPGAIQVTETVHRRLARDFLFRPRGSFYLPRIGAVQTFILASRL